MKESAWDMFRIIDIEYDEKFKNKKVNIYNGEYKIDIDFFLSFGFSKQEAIKIMQQIEKELKDE